MSHKYTVLVVDDEPDLREVLASVIEMQGLNVHMAENGLAAFEIVQKYHVDAVITDVRMPQMTGVELLKKIREIKPDIPIIFLITGFADISAEECYKLGANGFVTKPFDIEKIVEEFTKAVKQVEAKLKAG